MNRYNKTHIANTLELKWCFLIRRLKIIVKVSNHVECDNINGSSSLFTTYVASWLATVLLELCWDFNGKFTG